MEAPGYISNRSPTNLAKLFALRPELCRALRRLLVRCNQSHRRVEGIKFDDLGMVHLSFRKNKLIMNHRPLLHLVYSLTRCIAPKDRSSLLTGRDHRTSELQLKQMLEVRLDG